MEASEKLDIPLDAAGTVRVLGDRLVVERLDGRGRARRASRARARRGRARARRDGREAIEIGARVLEREGTAAKVDYVRAEFGKHAGDLAERLSKTLESGNDMLAEEIAESFGADRQGRSSSRSRRCSTGSAERAARELARQFSAKDGTNPLFDFKDAVVRVLKEADAQQQRESEANRKRIEALTREIVELKERDRGRRRVAEAEEAGTRKGRSFEERVHDAIERIADARGDVAIHTGGERRRGRRQEGRHAGRARRRRGPAAGRIVFEAKDKKLSATTPGAS